MINKSRPFWPLILLLAIIKFILPFILSNAVFDLQRDEFLYYQQGQHLALGYLENPPLLSYLAALSSLLGGTTFWIKFWPALFGAGTVIITCLLAAAFGGKKFAQLLTGITICTGSYLRIHALFQPNVLDIFFWTLSIYFIVRYISDKQTKFLYWLAISIALGFWGKYSAVFIAAGIVTGLLLSKQRTIFLEKKLYSAGILCLLLILPNIWWQYNHNWPLIHHMKELQETQLKFGTPVEFIADQLKMLTPAVVVWITGLAWLLKNSQWRFLSYTYFVVILLLILGSGKGYYALGIYPMLLAAGGVAWEQFSQKRYWIRYSICLLIIAITFLILPVLLPTQPPEKLARFYEKIGIKHKWEDQENHPLPQDFADMLGWKEIAEKTEKAYYTGLPDTARVNTLIYCDNYGQAGALKFYGEHAAFKKMVVSDNGSFVLWLPDSIFFKHLLYVTEKVPAPDNKYFKNFEGSMIMDSITNPFSRQYGNKIIFFRNADNNAIKFFRESFAKTKKEFSR